MLSSKDWAREFLELFTVDVIMDPSPDVKYGVVIPLDAAVMCCCNIDATSGELLLSGY
jgi:hypothetical protein